MVISVFMQMWLGAENKFKGVILIKVQRCICFKVKIYLSTIVVIQTP